MKKVIVLGVVAIAMSVVFGSANSSQHGAEWEHVGVEKGDMSMQLENHRVDLFNQTSWIENQILGTSDEMALALNKASFCDTDDDCPTGYICAIGICRKRF